MRIKEMVAKGETFWYVSKFSQLVSQEKQYIIMANSGENMNADIGLKEITSPQPNPQLTYWVSTITPLQGLSVRYC